MKRKILQFNRGVLEEREEEIQPKNTKEDNKKFLKAFDVAFDLGGRIALPIVGGTIGGFYLDKVFGTAPALTLSLLFIGIVVSFYTIIRLSRDIS